jgi:hypothetical protein
MPVYDSPICVDCSLRSAVTNTNYTRVSLAGWRSLRHREIVAGRPAIEWRCPACWKRYKRSGGLAGQSTRVRAAPSADGTPPDGFTF